MQFDTKCYPPERNPWTPRPKLLPIEFGLALRRTRMSNHTDNDTFGFLYEFGDLLLAVTAVMIPLIALPLYFL